MTGDDYAAAYHEFDGDLPDDVPDHQGEWRLALTWGALPSACRPEPTKCSVGETPAVDPDRGWPHRAWCECGWLGPVRTLEVAAAIDLANHAWPDWQDQLEEQDPSKPDDRKRGHWLDGFTNRRSRVVRVNVCGGGSSWEIPALCRGAIPHPRLGPPLDGALIVCVCPAHWDPAEAKLRGEAERLYQAQWEERIAARWRARRAGLSRPSPLTDDGQLTLF